MADLQHQEQDQGQAGMAMMGGKRTQMRKTNVHMSRKSLGGKERFSHGAEVVMKEIGSESYSADDGVSPIPHVEAV